MSKRVLKVVETPLQSSLVDFLDSLDGQICPTLRTALGSVAYLLNGRSLAPGEYNDTSSPIYLEKSVVRICQLAAFVFPRDYQAVLECVGTPLPGSSGEGVSTPPEEAGSSVAKGECRTSSEEAGSSVAKVEYVAYPKVSIAEALDIQEEKHTGTGVLALLPQSVYSTDDAHAWREQFGDYPPSSIGNFDELINDLTDVLSEIVVDDLSFAAESVQEKFKSFSHKYNSILRQSLDRSAHFTEDVMSVKPEYITVAAGPGGGGWTEEKITDHHALISTAITEFDDLRGEMKREIAAFKTKVRKLKGILSKLRRSEATILREWKSTAGQKAETKSKEQIFTNEDLACLRAITARKSAVNEALACFPEELSTSHAKLMWRRLTDHPIKGFDLKSGVKHDLKSGFHNPHRRFFDRLQRMRTIIIQADPQLLTRFEKYISDEELEYLKRNRDFYKKEFTYLPGSFYNALVILDDGRESFGVFPLLRGFHELTSRIYYTPKPRHNPKFRSEIITLANGVLTLAASLAPEGVTAQEITMEYMLKLLVARCFLHSTCDAQLIATEKELKERMQTGKTDYNLTELSNDISRVDKERGHTVPSRLPSTLKFKLNVSIGKDVAMWLTERRTALTKKLRNETPSHIATNSARAQRGYVKVNRTGDSYAKRVPTNKDPCRGCGKVHKHPQGECSHWLAQYSEYFRTLKDASVTVNLIRPFSSC